MNLDVLGHFFGADGEGHRFDFLPRLSEVRCPTLVMSGEIDPVTPVEQSERHRQRAALPPRALRALRRLRPRRGARRPAGGTKHDPRVHPGVAGVRHGGGRETEATTQVIDEAAEQRRRQPAVIVAVRVAPPGLRLL